MHPSLRGNGIGARRARMANCETRKQAVLSQWLQYLWFILPVVAVPLAILLGARRTNGAIIVCCAGAILAVAFRGYRTASSPIDFSSGGGYGTLDTIVSQVGGSLLLAAWTLVLVLAHAAQARRWWWFAIFVVAGFLSYATQLVSELLPVMTCSLNPSGYTSLTSCPPPNQALLALITLGETSGPTVALIYVLRAPGRRQRRLPEGLVVSSLRDEVRPGEDVVSAD
jgi:hypothetical protein